MCEETLDEFLCGNVQPPDYRFMQFKKCNDARMKDKEPEKCEKRERTLNRKLNMKCKDVFGRACRQQTPSPDV